MSELKARERCYGIDLLKTLSMFMVVILHTLGQGGMLWNAVFPSQQFNIVWLLELASYGAVNCFAIATGFLMVGRAVKYRKLVSLWLCVEFYNVFFFVLTKLAVIPGLEGVWEPNFTPVFSKKFWYFTAYFCLFIFVPFLNKLIDSISKRSFYILLLAGFLLFSLGFVIFKKDAFGMEEGYTPWWLMYLYFIGAGMKKYGLFSKISARLALLGYLASVIITFVIVYITYANAGVLGKIVANYGWQFVNYLSPTILAAAIFFTVFCIKLRLPRSVGTVFGKMQPYVFQVYIIHQHGVIWNGVLPNRFQPLLDKPWYVLPWYVLGVALLIFASCFLLDVGRGALFKLLRVDRLVNTVADKLNAAYQRSALRTRLLAFLQERVGI